jgi:Protein of unknown function (DUF3108)
MSPLLILVALVAKLAGPDAFNVGESLNYEAKLGYFPVGQATISVARLANERGVQSFVFTMTGQGGPPGLRLRYDLTSWVDRQRFNSLRFHRRLEQAGKVEGQEYIILPDSGRYRQAGVSRDWVAPSKPLDELAFLYFLRTLTLEPGRSYSLSRYFRNGYNPVQVEVTGRESVTLPEGVVQCLALRVTSRDLVMRLWLTDDRRRLPAQMEVPLPFGTVTLVLAGTGNSGEAGK